MMTLIERLRGFPSGLDCADAADRIAELTSMVDEHGAEMWKQGEEYAILSCKQAESLARIAELEAALSKSETFRQAAYDVSVGCGEELAALRRKIDEAPVVAWSYRSKINGDETLTHQPPDRVIEPEQFYIQPLYTHPAQSPEGWLRAVDEAMVGSHLGVADASDSYEVAKKKLNDLICWNVAVATDPAVNGGWQLVPVEPTHSMIVQGNSGFASHDSTRHTVAACYKAMLAAAPKPGEMK